MSNPERVWLRPPHGEGEPREVEATPTVLLPLMLTGWVQCSPPMDQKEEGKPDVDE